MHSEEIEITNICENTQELSTNQDSTDVKVCDFIDCDTKSTHIETTELINDTNTSNELTMEENVTFKVVYCKKKFDVSFGLDKTITDLKKYIETLTEVPTEMQKLMFKGRLKEDETLKDNQITNGSKLMLIGSTINAVMSVSQPVSKGGKEASAISSNTKELLCKQKMHKNVLDKYGKPEDVMIGIKNVHDSLPTVPISGMYNKTGGKVRLTFKLEVDQIWIGLKERTDKISLGSIKSIVNEPIEGNEEYHMMGLQLGTTELSRLWIYWVPAQYINSIKNTILGNWQLF